MFESSFMFISWWYYNQGQTSLGVANLGKHVCLCLRFSYDQSPVVFFFVTMTKCSMCHSKNIKTGFWKMLGWMSALLAIRTIGGGGGLFLLLLLCTALDKFPLRDNLWLIDSRWVLVLDSAEPVRSDLLQFLPLTQIWLRSRSVCIFTSLASSHNSIKFGAAFKPV